MNKRKQLQVKFPLWQYLNQPLLYPQGKLVLNPRRFALLYRVEFLNKCLARECDAKRHY
jgi:hypothetical protein